MRKYKLFSKLKNRTGMIARWLQMPIYSIFFAEAIRKYKGHRKVLLLLTPEHGNIGDQSIAYGTRKWAEDEFKGYLLLEFTYHETLLYLNAIVQIAGLDDIVLLHGGGNIGDYYLYEERARRKVIQAFSIHRIVLMPQTILFSNSRRGSRQLELTKKRYSRHRKLMLLCREEQSYLNAKAAFPGCKVKLCPDIAHYIQPEMTLDKCGKVLLCLRNDVESLLGQDVKDVVMQILRDMPVAFDCYDTDLGSGIFKETREHEIRALQTFFSKYDVIITDRFHGMIFSVLTNRFCILFNARGHKIYEGVKWYGGEGVHIIDDLEGLAPLIRKGLKEKIDHSALVASFHHIFKQIAEEIIADLIEETNKEK